MLNIVSGVFGTHVRHQPGLHFIIQKLFGQHAGTDNLRSIDQVKTTSMQTFYQQFRTATGIVGDDIKGLAFGTQPFKGVANTGNQAVVISNHAIGIEKDDLVVRQQGLEIFHRSLIFR